MFSGEALCVLLLLVKSVISANYQHPMVESIARSLGVDASNLQNLRVPAGSKRPHLYMKHLFDQIDYGSVSDITVRSYRSNPGWPIRKFKFNPREWPESLENLSVQLVLPDCYRARHLVTVNGVTATPMTISTGSPKTSPFLILNVSTVAVGYVSEDKTSVVLDIIGLDFEMTCFAKSIVKTEEAPLLIMRALDVPDSTLGVPKRDRRAPPAGRRKRGIFDLVSGSGLHTDLPDPVSICRLHSWYVDFADLNWDKIIVSPQGYNANYCAGSCSYPLIPTFSVNGTNHAFLKYMYRRATSDKSVRSTSSCVPVSYSYINLLYFDNDDNLFIKRIPEMVVDDCACL